MKRTLNDYKLYILSYRRLIMETNAVRIGNLVTELHEVLNAYYPRKIDRNKAIVKMVTKIYEAGYNDNIK